MAQAYRNISPKPHTFATKGEVVVPDDNTVLDVKAVEVTDVSGGAVLVIQPLDNADGDWITYTGVPVGFRPAFRVKRVGAGTTCGVAALLD